MMQSPTKWSRRELLTTLTGAGAAMMLNPLTSWATDEVNPDRVTPDRVDPRVAAIVAKTIGIDTHNHIDVPFTAAEVPGPQLDLTGEMKRSGLSAICMTFSVDRPALVNPGDAYERFKNALASMDKILAQNGVKRSLNLADLRAAHTKHQPTVIQSVEGGHFLEGHIERLEEAYNRGLRHLGLLHDNDASVPLGDVYTNPPQWGGLTAFGSDVIRECNRLGILVDLTHASNEMVNAALKVATKPVILSHTGLDTQLGQNERMAGMMKPRLIGERTNQAWADQKFGFYYALIDTLLTIGFSENEIGQVGGGNFCRVFDAATAGHR